jgi:hypothetical protein
MMAAPELAVLAFIDRIGQVKMASVSTFRAISGVLSVSSYRLVPDPALWKVPLFGPGAILLEKPT